MTFNLTKGQCQDREKGQIHLIGYSFRSNCHIDFKLGSCFTLWKAAPNMTLTLTFDLDLEKLAPILVVEWWNFQGLIATLTSATDSILKG